VGASVPASAHDISGVTGRAGYAGIQNDGHGNLYLVEDGGGRGGPTTPNAMHRTHSSIPICAVMLPIATTFGAAKTPTISRGIGARAGRRHPPSIPPL
jgi:hypothetical protein